MATRGGATRLGGPALPLGLLLAVLPGCALLPRERPHGPVQEGLASWYGPGLHGGRTASGERFDADDFTAAHPTLPLGSRVLVTNLANGRSVTVRINDRGPYVRGRTIDLSRAAARRLGMLRRGTARVRIQLLGHPETTSDTRARSRGPRRPRAVRQQGTR